jgi:hypothetical protein
VSSAGLLGAPGIQLGRRASAPRRESGVPVDGGHRGSVAGPLLDEPACEVVAAQERAFVDEQGHAGFEGAEADGAESTRP